LADPVRRGLTRPPPSHTWRGPCFILPDPAGFARTDTPEFRSMGERHDQGDQGYRDDGARDQLELSRRAVGQAAQHVDDRDQDQQDQARDDLPLEHHAADGGEGDRGSGPGQRGSLPGQAGVALARGARWLLAGAAGVARLAGAAGLAGGHRRAEARTTTAATTAIAAMITVMTTGMTDRGSGCWCRMARWLLVHSP